MMLCVGCPRHAPSYLQSWGPPPAATLLWYVGHLVSTHNWSLSLNSWAISLDNALMGFLNNYFTITLVLFVAFLLFNN